jgi:hypothetical protein
MSIHLCSHACFTPSHDVHQTVTRLSQAAVYDGYERRFQDKPPLVLLPAPASRMAQHQGIDFIFRIET